jgi:hypothetical protein
MSTPHALPSERDAGPVRVDAALRQTVALLELVRQEEALLGWLSQCVIQLQAVHRARQTLLDVTDAELSEAEQFVANTDDLRTGSAWTEEAGS